MKARSVLMGSLPWAALLVALTCLGILLAHRWTVDPISNATDFRAFYCAGSVVDARVDSYRVEPLRACEEAVLASQRLGWIKGLVVPAPLPPYALAFFGLLARLPFVVASSFWCALAIVAWLRTARRLGELTTLPFRQVILATFALGLFVSFGYGQIVPLEMCLVVEAAALLHAGKLGASAVFATLALLEPQIGGPVFLSMFVLRRESRRPLGVGLLALVALSLAFVGPAQCIEWFTRVLPVHESSELFNAEQFSLTTALALAGLPAALARLAGSLDYAIMVCLAIWAASRIDRRWTEPAAIVLIPSAFAMLGGPYVHQHQFAAVLPLASLGYARTGKVAFVIAIGLLACPWLSLAESFPQIHEIFWPWHRVVLTHVPPTALADVVWQQFMAVVRPTPQSIIIATLVKLPLWSGVAVVVVATVREALGVLERANVAQPLVHREHVARG